MNEVRVTYLIIQTDLGYYLKKNSLEPDVQKINENYVEYTKKIDKLVEEETSFCRQNHVDLIFLIVPFLFKIARKLRIRSISISNFTWYTANKRLIPKVKLEILKEYYSNID